MVTVLINFQMNSLNTLQSKLSSAELFQYAALSGILHRFLSIGKLQPNMSARNGQCSTILAELLIHFLMSASVNCLELHTTERRLCFGKGLYQYASLLNHSCSPNVMRVVYKSKQAVVALRIIKPGEQLLMSYG